MPTLEDEVVRNKEMGRQNIKGTRF